MDVLVSVCLMSVRPSVCVCLQKKAFSIFVLLGVFLTAEGNISEFFMYIFSLCQPYNVARWQNNRAYCHK